jgi:hypothetical protein
MANITEKSTVSLTVLAILLSAAGYVTYAYAQQTNHTRRIEILEANVAAFQQISVDIAVIKTNVGNIKESLDKERNKK